MLCSPITAPGNALSGPVPDLAYGLAALSLLIASSLVHAGPDFPDTVAKVKPAIVGIGTYMPIRRPPAVVVGTGFAIRDGSLIVTNAHVIDEKLDLDKRERRVVFVGKGREAEVRDAQVIAGNKRYDLAVLKLSGAPIPTVVLGNSADARDGDAIAFTGFPIGAVLGLYPVTHRGIISAITPIAIPANRANALTPDQILTLRDPFVVFQLDATAYPGNSGSPVYRRDDGSVIAVINRVFVKGKKENILKDPSAITYAIPIEHLKALLDTVE